MGDDDRAAALEAQHAELDDALSAETARPMPDAVVVADLKKRKLRIKDELARLREPAG